METESVQTSAATRTPSPLFAKLSECYRTTAVIFLNLCLLLFVANGVMWLMGLPRPRSLETLAGAVFMKYGEAQVAKAYPGWELDEIRRLHAETWAERLVYDGFSGYREKPRSGTYVNVDANGFRRVENQGPWPPDPDRWNVFVFGGSTVFGYGLADGETIPSRVQSALVERFQSNSISVYNFGRAYYYSSQERVLFERLLVGGFRPDAAVFVDGLNEVLAVRDEPMRPHHVIDDPSAANSGINRLPLMRLFNGFLGVSGLASKIQTIGLDQVRAEEEVASLGLRYLKNRDLIRSAAKREDVRALFVWQPIPFYMMNAASNPFASPDSDSQERELYQWMREENSGEKSAPDFLWAAELHSGQKGILYVDEVHYSETFCRSIAEAIANRLADSDG